MGIFKKLIALGTFALLLLVSPITSFAATDTSTSNAGAVGTNSVIGGGGGGTYYYPGTSVAIKPGDVLITSDTSVSGLNGVGGHAGIVTDGLEYATIEGEGDHPVLKSISSWFKSNPDTKVVRYTNLSDSSRLNAANWAFNYVQKYSTAYYDFSPLDYMFSTYCSKIVWDAYNYGANYDLPTSYNIITLIDMCYPYGLDNVGKVEVETGKKF